MKKMFFFFLSIVMTGLLLFDGTSVSAVEDTHRSGAWSNASTYSE